jgi:plasmid stabilization system protein ParE
MPAWTEKDERQFEHIRDDALERGRNAEQAREIAARTVNKRRRTSGRTPKGRTSGTGNPNTSLEERTRDELYERARELHIRGRSGMTKSGLIAAIRERNG